MFQSSRRPWALIAQRQVVHDGVAGNVVHCFVHRDIAPGPADDDGELGLPVDLLGIGRQAHLGLGADHAMGRELDEVHGPHVGLVGGRPVRHFLHMVGKVREGAEDGVGIEDRREQPGALERHRNTVEGPGIGGEASGEIGEHWRRRIPGREHMLGRGSGICRFDTYLLESRGERQNRGVHANAGHRGPAFAFEIQQAVIGHGCSP